jgi:hypothetical protein
MEEILNRLFPQPQYVSGLLGDESQIALQQARQQGLLGLAAGLLQAGGPSRQRTNIGQAIGAGLQAGQQAYRGALSEQIQGQQMAMKLAEQQRLQQQQRALQGIMPQLMTTGLQQAERAADPIGALLQTIEAGTTNQPMLNQQALNLARSFLSPKDFKDLVEGLTKQQELAAGPREEYSTTPQTMLVNNRPTSVLFSKSGGMRVLDVQPLPSEEKIDTNSEILFRDKVTGRITSRLNKTLSPGEARLLDLREREFQRGGYDILQTQEGYVYAPTTPGAVAQPVTTAGGAPVLPMGADKPPTEGQAKAASFLGVMRGASSVFDQPLVDPAGKPVVDASGQQITAEMAYSTPNLLQSAAGSVPWVGQTLERLGSSENRQRVLQAQQAWVRAKLRKESGAVIGADEMADEIKTFFPQYGDKPETIRQKALLRQQAESGLVVEAGPAARLIQTAPGAQITPPARVQRQARPQVELRYNPQTRRIEEAQ